jgi:hypothetical protein
MREGVLAEGTVDAPSVIDLVRDGARQLSSYLGFESTAPARAATTT